MLPILLFVGADILSFHNYALLFPLTFFSRFSPCPLW